MPKQYLKTALLSLLLATTFAVAARAQITLLSVTRDISAQTDMATLNPVASEWYDITNQASSSGVGEFSQSYTQGTALPYCQVYAVVSHQSRLAFTPDNLQWSGTLHLTNSMAVQDDNDIPAVGTANFQLGATAELEITSSGTLQYTLTATTSHLTQHQWFETTFQWNGWWGPDYWVGDAAFIGNNPPSVSLSGTLDPGVYDLRARLSTSWGNNGFAESLLWDDRKVVFAFHAWTTSSLHMDSAVVSGANLAASGSSGVINGAYYVISSTDLALPLTNWTVLATNAFDGSGNFAFNYTVNPAEPQRFFTIRLP